MKGHPVAFGNYHDATKHGVFRIFQELAMVPNLAIYENLFLSHEEHFSRGGVISRRRMINRAKDMLAQFDHGWVDPRREASSYDFSTRQVVEIIKAFALAELLEVETPVILLDEPTAGLSREEIDFFGGVLRSISDRAGVVFVSHRLSELLEFRSRIYVIKDGEVVAQPNPNEITESELHHLMVGRKRDETFYKERLQREPETTSALRVRGLQRTPDVTDVDLEVRAGEIVGIAGVLGSGKSEFARAIFEPPADRLGEVSVGDQPVKQHQISAMLDAGVGYVSPDRHKDGIILGFPVAWNISLSALPAVRRWLLKPARERLDAKKHIESLRIKTNGPDAMAGTLSGGNQQKVILAKWLERKPKVLIFDNPTKGVDAGAKEDIYGILRQFVADGGGILLVSGELVELIGLSNRVVVMRTERSSTRSPRPSKISRTRPISWRTWPSRPGEAIMSGTRSSHLLWSTCFARDGYDGAAFRTATACSSRRPGAARGFGRTARGTRLTSDQDLTAGHRADRRRGTLERCEEKDHGRDVSRMREAPDGDAGGAPSRHGLERHSFVVGHPGERAAQQGRVGAARAKGAEPHAGAGRRQRTDPADEAELGGAVRPVVGLAHETGL